MPTDFCGKVRSEVSVGHISHQCVLTGITSVGDKARDGVGRAEVSHEPRLLISSAADVCFFVVSWDSKVLAQKSLCGSCQLLCHTWEQFRSKGARACDQWARV